MDTNNSKTLSVFENVKSKYIFKRIFKYLSETKLLKIIKYNKILQNKLEINIDDYKNISKIIIELEMQPDHDGIHRNFINFENKNKDYFHIYLNYSEEETKNKYCFEPKEKAQPIKIIIDHQQNSLYRLFYYCKHIKKIKFVKFSRKDIVDMSSLYHFCIFLQEIDFSYFNTENVINMESMFFECKSLKQIDLSNFNTKNVTNISKMFNECSSLRKLDLSNLDTKNITTINNKL